MEIEKAFKRLLIKSPFYGLFCMSLPKNVTTEIPTLAVRKSGLSCELLINPDFWNQHTDDEQIALLQHELSHICFQHMFMVDSFKNKKLFNLCADFEVNSYIENLPKSACLASQVGLKSRQGTKYYYEQLNSNPPQSNQGGSGEGEEGDNKDGSGGSDYPDFMPEGIKPLDSHDNWKGFDEAPSAVKQLIQNNINTTLKNVAEQVEKQCGSIPGGISELLEKLREKKPEIFNWKAYFRRILGTIYDINLKKTRKKESKRFAGNAGVKHRRKVSILVAVDTSGSVSNKELQEFFNEIDYIYKAGARVTILECDTRINKVVEYDGKNIPEIVGRGGTNFDPPIDYYIEHKKEYASLIYFTDGECSLPKKHPLGVVWVITSNGMHQNYPGKVIYIPKDNGKR